MAHDLEKILNQKIAELESQLAALRSAKVALRGGGHLGGVKTGSRRLSAEGRARIAAAAKKRWAAYRKQKQQK
jgi:hypothetical protein